MWNNACIMICICRRILFVLNDSILFLRTQSRKFRIWICIEHTIASLEFLLLTANKNHFFLFVSYLLKNCLNTSAQQQGFSRNGHFCSIFYVSIPGMNMSKFMYRRNMFMESNLRRKGVNLKCHSSTIT
jgi:hypothetical protein